MSDHLTDAMVEQAALADLNHWRAERPALAPLPSLDDVPHADEWRDGARAALSAVVPAIVQAAKVDALRDAADEVRDYAYQPDDVSGPLPADQQPAYLAGATDAHRVVDRLLKDRADRIKRGES